MENKDTTPATVTTYVAGTFLLTGPGVTSGVGDGTCTGMGLCPARVGRSVSLAAYDGVPDFMGPSGFIFDPQSSSASAATTLTSSEILAQYAGTGYVTFSDLAEGASFMEGPGNVVVRVSQYASAQVTVTYHYIPTVTIGNYVWLDVDANGLQDESPARGVNGVTVELLGDGGNLVTTTVTADDGSGNPGYYLFSDQAPGTYSVRFVLPTSYVFTSRDAGGNAFDEIDSDATPGSGVTGSYTLVAGEENLTVDAGIRTLASTLASLGNFVWLDANGNGIQDVGEPGINGVTVRLLASGGNELSTTVTANDGSGNPGYYLFDNLPLATYQVQFVLPTGYVFTTQDVGGSSDQEDSDANVTTGKTGTYALLTGGQYNDTVDAGLLPAPPGIEIIKELVGNTVVAPYTPVTYTYAVTNTGGVAFPAADVVVIDDNATPGYADDDFSPTLVGGDLDASGSLDPGEVWIYQATVIPPVKLVTTNTGSPLSSGVVVTSEILASGDVKVTFIQDFGINDNTYGTGSIGWPANKPHTFGNLTGSDKLEFRLFDRAGNVAIDFYVDSISAATSALLSDGSTLRSYPAGYGTLGPFGGDGHMVSGDPAMLLDYSTGITENLNQPLNVPKKASLIVNSPTSLDGDNVVVDPIAAPGGWNYYNTYTVVVDGDAFAAGGGFGKVEIPDQHNSPSKVGINQITTTPTDNLVTNKAIVFIDADQDKAMDPLELSAGPSDATVYIVAQPSSLSGSVYIDANYNGVKDNGEGGIINVSVTLTGTGTLILQDGTIFPLPDPINMTAPTAADGSYSFSGLPRGTYAITEAQPAGYYDGQDKAGTAGGAVGNDVISSISLLANTNATGYTFGETTSPMPATKFFVVDIVVDQTFQYSDTGISVGNSALQAANADPRDIAAKADGSKLWVVDRGKYVYVYDSNGTAQGLWKANSLGTEPEGITLDGSDLWVADRGRMIYWYDEAAGNASGTYNATKTFTPAMSGNLKGIVTDGTSLWVVTEGSTDYVYRFAIARDGSGNPTGLTKNGQWKLAKANSKPTGITLDPTGASQSLWIVDESSDSVYEYGNGRSLASGTGVVTTSFKLAATNLAPQGIADPPVADPATSTAAPFVSGAGDVQIFGITGGREIVDHDRGGQQDRRVVALDACLGLYALEVHGWTGAEGAMYQPDASLARRIASSDARRTVRDALGTAAREIVFRDVGYSRVPVPVATAVQKTKAVRSSSSDENAADDLFAAFDKSDLRAWE